MEYYYTDERNAQIVVSLLKAHGIKRIIASPGTTDICLVASLTHDKYFEIYSSPEERSAGYMACGMAAESGEPVVIICTGATASRNYFPALTEAFYRKLPVLAITCSRRSYRIGHNYDQVTDRTSPPKDTAKMSVQVPLIYDDESEWNAIIVVNKAILELRHRGNGPVHINLETNYSRDYSTRKLPEARKIERVTSSDKFPKLNANKVAIFVGAHLKWSKELTDSVDLFCERNNSLVLSDHTGNYKGKYSICGCLAGQQTYTKTKIKDKFDLIIHIGDVHAPGFPINTERVWRVNPDGELRDPFRKLEVVFEMDELAFFKHYIDGGKKRTTLYEEYHKEEIEAQKSLANIIGELPFSNAWVASQTEEKLPSGSVLHLGIQNSLRFWNFFKIDNSINVYSNVGGFGIDGSMSSVIGAAILHKETLYFCVLGDLAFFYDINSLGNRHVPKNIRILLVNNGKGTEFKLAGNPGSMFGDETDRFIAAGGHYGNKSRTLVKHFAEDLGFKYLAADSKEQYIKNLDEFLDINFTSSIIMEVFTDSGDESHALTMIRSCMADSKDLMNGHFKKTVKNILGDKNVERLKSVIKK